MKVLIGDHDPHEAHALGAALDAAGCATRLTNHAAHALDEIIHWDPDAIIVDAALPGLADSALARRLNSNAPLHIPLLALSRSAAWIRDSMLSIGFDDVIQKPASLTDVLRAIYKSRGTPLERARRHVVEAERRTIEQQRRIDATLHDQIRHE